MPSVGMPVELGRPARFSTAEEVTSALGTPELDLPIPAGIIVMSDGQLVPVSLDLTYLMGPDTAHVNASGISGNAKTSYLLFLLQSTYQKLKQYEQDFALIIFNTKDKDLLQIDELEDENKRQTKEKYFDMLNLEMKPFENVTYFLPRGKDGKPIFPHIKRSDQIVHNHYNSHSIKYSIIISITSHSSEFSSLYSTKKIINSIL